jgi:hypothetical protein
MGRVRIGAAALCLLSAVTLATESSDLLEKFNEVSLEVPTIAYDDWDQDEGIESKAFKAFYIDAFNEYIDVASELAIRAVACANGDIPQTQDYQSMTDLKQLYVSIIESISSAETKLALWEDLNDQESLNELGNIVPSLTVSYSRMLFELSSCSGYLYGELVN